MDVVLERMNENDNLVKKRIDENNENFKLLEERMNENDNLVKKLMDENFKLLEERINMMENKQMTLEAYEEKYHLMEQNFLNRFLQIENNVDFISRDYYLELINF